MSIKSYSLPVLNIILTYCFGTLTISHAQVLTPLVIKDISAPHPKHCLDERQWQDSTRYSLFNLFDNDPKTSWIPCSYAIKDAGYTIHIDLESPIEIDGLMISQGHIESSEINQKKRRRQRSKSLTPTPKRHMIEKMQIILFNQEVSSKYPVYFQEIKFEKTNEVKIKYDGMLNWNPILLGDPMFDERRRALKMPQKGMLPPIKVDKIGLVFPQFDPMNPPPALKELSFFLRGKKLNVKSLEDSRRSYSEVMSKVYDLMVRDFMFIGDDRAMIFSGTGTIWTMEGEEEVAKVLGGWRFNGGRIEVDLSKRQQGRTNPNRRARIEKSRAKYYSPLHLILDEAPDRVLIKAGTLIGEYQTIKVAAPLNSQANQSEQAPSFEVP